MEIDEKRRQCAAEFQLTSDLFAGKVFEDLEACQELCRILLENDKILLHSVKSQYVIRNLEKHLMELDILAEEVNGNFIGIEIQMYRERAPLKRSRYYLSGIDMSILEKGKDYIELPDVTMIYITRDDFIGEGNGCYVIHRKLNDHEITMRLENGAYERYINLECATDNMRMNELLAYFKHSDPYYETKNFPRIVERVRYFKTKKEGITIMCEIADRIRNEGKEEGKIKGKAEAVLELLEDLGKVPQQIIGRIHQETNPGQLTKWLKNAAKAASITEFELNM